MIQTKPNGWHKLAFQVVIQIDLIVLFYECWDITLWVCILHSSVKFCSYSTRLKGILFIICHTILHSQGLVKQTWVNNNNAQMYPTRAKSAKLWKIIFTKIIEFKEAGNSFKHFSNSYNLKDEYYHCLTSDATI